MRVLTPSPESWAAGQRWYRCDLVEMDALDVWVPSPRATSLRNGLAGASPLRLSCFNRPTFGDGLIETIPPASCTGPHDTEFVGVWQAFDVPVGETVTDEDVAAGCLERAAEHVRVPARELARRVRVHTLTPDEPEWTAGVPGALCFVQAPESSLTRSLKGAGPGRLPPRRG